MGEVYAFSSAECSISLTNDGTRPIQVLDITPDNKDDSVKPDKLTIAPHSQGYVTVTANTKDELAGIYHRFQIRTDEPGHEKRVANAFAFVMTALDKARPELDFGLVDLTGTLPSKSILLDSHDSKKFQITKILEKPTWIDASLSSNGHELGVQIRPNAPWGIQVGYVKLAIDSPVQNQAWVVVKANIRGEVIPSFNPLDMGLMRIGTNPEFKIPLKSRTGKVFSVGKIQLQDVTGTAIVSQCQPREDGCQMLTLTISDAQQAGSIRGHISVEFPEFHQRLNLAVWGLLVSKDFKVQTLDAAELKRAESGGVESSLSRRSLNLSTAVKDAIHESDVPIPAGSGPLLKWTIANGLGIHGFQIFRSDNEDGKFTLVNRPTIPSTATTALPVNYQWRDNSVISGKTYWYYIGLVKQDGSKQQLSGPQKVIAK